MTENFPDVSKALGPIHSNRKAEEGRDYHGWQEKTNVHTPAGA